MILWLAEQPAMPRHQLRRYTPQGRSVTMLAERTGRWIQFKVTDTGRGLSPKLLARVFQPVVQGPRTVDRRVDVASEGAGRGNTFTVRLLSAPGAMAAL